MIMAATFCLILAGSAFAGVEQHPGYVDFAKFGLGAGEEATVEINLRGPMLKLAALAAEDDEDLGQMLSGLAGIFVRTYVLDDNAPDAFEKAISSISKHLDQTGWETIVKVRERDERAHIAVKMDGENIVGMTVLAFDENDPEAEVVFVNLVGLIDLTHIGRLGRHFDIDVDALDSLERESTKKDTTKKR
jgi:phosphoribosyl-dephospho-CoA transferase